MDNNIRENSIEYRIRVLAHGINRFMDEGMINWSKINIEGAINFRGVQVRLTAQDILEDLKQWETKGYIKIIGKDDRYIEVLKPIPIDFLK